MTSLRTRAAMGAVALVTSMTAIAHADTPPQAVEQARGHFQRGVELFGERNFGAALVEFRRANEAVPNHRLLYNIGQTCHELQDYVCAIQSFQEYLAKGGKDIAETRVAEVEETIKKLRGRVATIVVTVNEPGAEVQVDDRAVGTSPLSTPVTVSAGKRRLTATKAGRTPLARVVELAGGETTTVALAFEADKPAAGAPAPPPEPAAEPRGVPAGVWVGVGLTAALTAGAVVTGVLAGRAHSDYEQALATYPTTRGAIDDAASKTRTLSIAGDVLAGGAVLAGGLTLIFGLTSRSSAPAKVGVAASPTSIAVTGRF
jgi:hypothetical protein